MITFVIAFIVFCGSSFYSLESLLIGVAMNSLGADLIATMPTDFLKYTKTKSYLDEKRISHFLKNRIRVDPDIIDFSFVSQDLDVLLTHLGLTERLQQLKEATEYSKLTMNQLRAVQENYLNVVSSEYFFFDEVTEDYEKEMKL